jgi:hypothetical protein
VIATTDIPYYTNGNNRTQSRMSEEVMIEDIDETGTTITLSKALNYTHYGETQTVDGTTFSLMRYAEVGLISLTRNIVILGGTPSFPHYSFTLTILKIILRCLMDMGLRW